MYTWLCIWFHLGKLGLKATTHPLPKENANQYSTVKAIGVGEGSEEVEEASSSHPFKLGRLKTLKMDITFCLAKRFPRSSAPSNFQGSTRNIKRTNHAHQ
jgi:hypothetical protein